MCVWKQISRGGVHYLDKYCPPWNNNLWLINLYVYYHKSHHNCRDCNFNVFMFLWYPECELTITIIILRFLSWSLIEPYKKVYAMVISFEIWLEISMIANGSSHSRAYLAWGVGGGCPQKLDLISCRFKQFWAHFVFFLFKINYITFITIATNAT